MKKKKVKEIFLPMKFNLALQKFEPELPTIKSGKKVKIKLTWELITIITVLLSILGFWIIVFLIQPKVS